MTIIKRNYPGFPEITNWLEDIFTSESDYFVRSKFPCVNISETNDLYKIEIAAPGYIKEDFSLNVEYNVLTVKANKQIENAQQKENFTKREYYVTKFERSFTLPDTADLEKIQAKCDAGILTISIGKKDEAKIKPSRNINID